MPLLCIVITVPAPWGPIVDAARERFQAGTRHMPAHVTLIPPFQADDTDHLIDQVARTVRSLQPFNLTLAGTGTFRPQSRVVFLQPTDGAEECAELRAALAQDSANESGREFHPHVTLANRCADSVLDDAAAEFADFACTFRVDRVSVYEHGNAGWQVISEAQMAPA